MNKLQKIILVLLFICQKTITFPGNKVPCQNSGNCSSCGQAMLDFEWVTAGDSTNCQIKSCLAASFPTTNLEDNFCFSCGGDNKYASFDQTSCVSSSRSCNSKSGWNDADCDLCNKGKLNLFASTDNLICVAASASCTRNDFWTDTDCLICNHGIGNIYANINYSGCSSRSRSECLKTYGWADDDCKICYTTGNIYAKYDTSGCQSTVPSPGSLVPCQQNGSCSFCGGTPQNISWIKPKANGDTQNCLINDCLVDTFAAGLSDNFCFSCEGNKYANTAATACVLSSATCSRQNNWHNADCILCTNNQYKYASTDRTSCLVDNPSSSTSNQCQEGFQWSSQDKICKKICTTVQTDSFVILCSNCSLVADSQSCSEKCQTLELPYYYKKENKCMVYCLNKLIAQDKTSCKISTTCIDGFQWNNQLKICESQKDPSLTSSTDYQNFFISIIVVLSFVLLIVLLIVYQIKILKISYSKSIEGSQNINKKLEYSEQQILRLQVSVNELQQEIVNIKKKAKTNQYEASLNQANEFQDLEEQPLSQQTIQIVMKNDNQQKQYSHEYLQQAPILQIETSQ
ncbi:hypothetical protein ABPG72_021384 [Tetrahymena utriculariae]